MCENLVESSSIFFNIGGGKYTDRALELTEPPAVSLLVVNVDDVTGSNTQFVIHVGSVVVEGPTRANARRVPAWRNQGTATAAANARVVDLADVPLALVLIVAGNANGRGRGCSADTAAHKAAAAIKKITFGQFYSILCYTEHEAK